MAGCIPRRGAGGSAWTMRSTVMVPGPAGSWQMVDGLVSDLYELTMAADYLRRAMTGPATFSLFVRELPLDRVPGAAGQHVIRLRLAAQPPHRPRPSPRGIRASSASMNVCSRPARSAWSRSASNNRTPQEMSKPTPPGETTPPRSTSVAPPRRSGTRSPGARPASHRTPRRCRAAWPRSDLLQGAVGGHVGQQRRRAEHHAGHPHRPRCSSRQRTGVSSTSSIGPACAATRLTG